jgi:selenocysteine-specific elongation factor
MITIGLAGHIDHGKSALVRALTHMNPDRLPEEQRRGMTIDLGFSWLALPGGEKIGVTDVPGHKDFMKNVIAGLWGIDAALLVVAADDGWMPQTEEHFQILRFLNIRHAVVAVTKIDLVSDPDWLDMVEEDILGRLEGTNLAGSCVVRVDSLSGTNVQRLGQEIELLVLRIKRKRDIGKPRLPIDRIFTIKGIGTVVTGTLVDGSLSKDEPVFIPSLNANKRIRGLEAYKEAICRAEPGSRVAVNLVGVEKDQLKRGDTLFGAEGQAARSRSFDAAIECVPQLASPLTGTKEVMVYLGTRECFGRIRLLGARSIRPGERGFGQFSFNEPVFPRIGDRFIIRRPSPPETIGGGMVLDISSRRHRLKEDERVALLQARENLDLAALIRSELTKNKYMKREGLWAASPYSASQIDECIKTLADENRVVTAGSWVLGQAHWGHQMEKAIEVLSAEHANHPLEIGMDRAKLQSSLNLPEDSFHHFIGALKESGRITHGGDTVALSEHRPVLSPTHELMASRMRELFKKNPTTPPTKNELLVEIPGCEDVVQFMCRQGVLVGLPEGILLEHDQYQVMKMEIVRFLSHEGSISIQQVRDLFGLSRKYILPLLSRLDKEGITIKQGDLRILAAGKAVVGDRQRT